MVQIQMQLTSELFNFVVNFHFRTRQIEYEIEIPAPEVTSMVFGGENLDKLYVKSASKNLLGQTEPQPPEGGRLFCIRELGERGLGMANARIPEYYLDETISIY